MDGMAPALCRDLRDASTELKLQQEDVGRGEMLGSYVSDQDSGWRVRRGSRLGRPPEGPCRAQLSCLEFRGQVCGRQLGCGVFVPGSSP